ncbi:short chain dehydrogenase [Geomonas sp. RF6]|uniref:short chain dehydrogenase n=1 Tax=Geomonas sp. RF6 TaxID=2897342 RepID=UPI001E3F1064|nr:short chain dehydrogenase [Geomonas sp. RF6]UFS71214.1 short chain dehydrogenase [Geomonas sp. RF6]
MKVIVIGATGTIGKAVVRLLSPLHDLARVGLRRGDFQVDLTHKSSIERLFQDIGPFDGLICAAGLAKFDRIVELSDEDFQLGLTNKLMGQVNLVRLGLGNVREGGSFTLTSGVLSQRPMPGSASISMVNAGIEAFVRAAALEMPRKLRINAVSPPWVKETLEALGMDSSLGMPAERVALAYRASLEGQMSGKVIDARDFA